jgi:hypothetical protein
MSPGSYPFGSSPSPFERMSSLERDCVSPHTATRVRSLILSLQCSNFTCCGLHLSDLHSLLEHFEETHVVVIDNAGNAVFPRTRAAADFDNFHLSSAETDHQTDHMAAYPYTSFVCGYPQLDPQPIYAPNQPQDQYQPQAQSEPVSPIEVESPTPYASFPLRTFLEHEHTIEDSDSLADLDAFSSESDNILSSPTSRQPLALPPASFVTDSPIRRGNLEHHPRGAYKSRILGTKPRPQLRRREKAHKCPVRSFLSLQINCSASHAFAIDVIGCRHPVVQKYVASIYREISPVYLRILLWGSRTSIQTV